jgi:phosphate acetyltransferase
MPDTLPIEGHEKFKKLVARAQEQPPVPTAVAHPCDTVSLSGAVEGAKLGLIAPILVGPEDRIRDTATRAGLDIGPFDIVDAEHSHDAAGKAVALVRAG